MGNQYELIVQSILLGLEVVDVTVGVVLRQMPSFPIFTIQVSVERNKGDLLSEYESLAKSKATIAIQSVACELAQVA